MAAAAIYGSTKPPLSHAELRDAINLSLWVGQLLLQHGAETQRIEETVHRMGTGLGCDWMDILISPNALLITASSGEEFRTKTRRVVSIGVNMDIITQINTLSRQVTDGQITAAELYKELRRISDMPRLYPRWLIVLLVGLACAAFSRLFNGDTAAFFVTLIAASIAMFVRQEFTHRYFNPYITTIVTAFAAGLVASAGAVFHLSDQPQVALATSVLLLVPGVPLINCAEDLMKGHMVTGLVRGLNGALISVCIAIGLLLAMTLTGAAPGEAITEAQTVSDFGGVVGLLIGDAFWSAIAALGFALLFNTPTNLLLYCAACGAIGHASRMMLMHFGMSVEIATLFGATLVGFAAFFMARRAQAPALIFGITGAIPMVPGWFAYRAMIGIISFSTNTPADSQLLLSASNSAIKTGVILAAIAVGIAAPALLFERNKPVV